MKLKAICPSLCLLTVTLKAQQSVHQLKQDLLEMKTEAFGTTKYVFKSLHMRLLIHMSAQKAQMQAKQPFNHNELLFSW